MADKAKTFSPFYGFRALNDGTPATLYLVAAVVIVVIAVWPLAAALRRHAGRRPAQWQSDVWWGLLATGQLALLGLAPAFYYHYAAWGLAPVCLVLGAAASRIARGRTGGLLVAGGVVLGSMLVVMATSNLRYVDRESTSRSVLEQWAQSRTCIWGHPHALVLADAVARNLAHDCRFMVDPFGVGLTLYLPSAINRDTDITIGNPQWRAVAWSQIEGSDGVLLPADAASQWFDEPQQQAFNRQFNRSFTVRINGDETIVAWTRRPFN